MIVLWLIQAARQGIGDATRYALSMLRELEQLRQAARDLRDSMAERELDECELGRW